MSSTSRQGTRVLFSGSSLLRPLLPGPSPPSPTPASPPPFRVLLERDQTPLPIDAGLRPCGKGCKVTSDTELVSCAEPGYPRCLSGGRADSGDFGAGHYVRTALLALPGSRGARLRLRGSQWLPCPLGRLTLQSSLGGVVGRGELLLPPSLVEGARGGRSGTGASVRAWRPRRGWVPGARVRKLGH